MSEPASEYFTSFDGTRLHYRRWRRSNPRGIVVYVHGFQSHGEWFLKTCGALADAGFEVLALDRRGSGRSDGLRGHLDRAKTAVRDHRLFLEWVRSEIPERPCVLLAHSWGGLLGVILAGYRRSHDLVDALVLVSPGLAGRRRMISGWALLPFLVWSWLSPRRMLPVPYDEMTMLTSNRARAEWIRDDPLHWTQASVRFWWETAKLMIYVRALAANVDQPVFCALAGEDRLVDNGGVIEIVRRMKHIENRVKIYDGASHTLEFEAAAPAVVADTLDFLDVALGVGEHGDEGDA